VARNNNAIKLQDVHALLQRAVQKVTVDWWLEELYSAYSKGRKVTVAARWTDGDSQWEACYHW
jgi:hypothetical protein